MWGAEVAGFKGAPFQVTWGRSRRPMLGMALGGSIWCPRQGAVGGGHGGPLGHPKTGSAIPAFTRAGSGHILGLKGLPWPLCWDQAAGGEALAGTAGGEHDCGRG